MCPISGPEERKNLKAAIDLLVNDHVSWFEFDIFTRLYQPWKQIMNNWRVRTIKENLCALPFLLHFWPIFVFNSTNNMRACG